MVPEIKSRTRWFVIQQKSTGRLLPAPPVTYRGGQCSRSFEVDGPPRLFPSRPGANVAMKLWLKGNPIAPGWEYDEKMGRSRRIARYEDSRLHLIDDVHVVEVEISIADTPDNQAVQIPDFDIMAD